MKYKAERNSSNIPVDSIKRELNDIKRKIDGGCSIYIVEVEGIELKVLALNEKNAKRKARNLHKSITNA